MDEKTQFRAKLPVNQEIPKIHIWSLIKCFIGKDLSKKSMPVELNEPLSVLMKICEMLQNFKLVEKGVKTGNRFTTLACVLSMFYSIYFKYEFRKKKPYNSFLGETFDFEKGDFRFFAEQVSHHPPVSAFYAETDFFTLNGNL